MHVFSGTYALRPNQKLHWILTKMQPSNRYRLPRLLAIEYYAHLPT